MPTDDLGKLSTLLDDPEIRELVFALAHFGAPSLGEPGPSRLHAVVLRLADTTAPEQYHSWLSEDARNKAMTVDQVRSSIGEGEIDDLAQYVDGSSGAVAWQLAAVLPDLVDAVSPGGQIIDANRLARELAQAAAEDDRSAGAFGN